jgi:hypothetical protein
MLDTPIGREDLLTWLRAVERSDSSVEAMREWMRALFIGESVDLSERDADLVMNVVYQLDSTDSDADFIAVARTALAVLREVEPDWQAQALLLLAWESDRLIDVLDKYTAGTIGRTDFESFLRKRRWPAEIIQKTLALDANGRTRLLNALRAQDYFAVGCIFSGVRNPFDVAVGTSEGAETRRVVDRQEVERILNMVAGGAMSHEELLDWAGRVLTGEKFYVGGTEDNDLIWHVVYGLDEFTVPGRKGEIAACAARYRWALQSTPEASSADALLWLAGDHDRVVEQLRAYLTGRMSRETYALTIQGRAPAWPPKLIQTMLDLSDGDLRSMTEALQRDDYPEVLRILRI